jgi:hypothetical protein
MSAWRVIITDSESATGVAPVCEQQDDVTKHSSGDGFGVTVDPHGVYDCCPQPHIETWWEDGAKRLAELLTELDAAACS